MFNASLTLNKNELLDVLIVDTNHIHNIWDEVVNVLTKDNLEREGSYFSGDIYDIIKVRNDHIQEIISNTTIDVYEKSKSIVIDIKYDKPYSITAKEIFIESNKIILSHFLNHILDSNKQVVIPLYFDIDDIQLSSLISCLILKTIKYDVNNLTVADIVCYDLKFIPKKENIKVISKDGIEYAIYTSEV